MLANFYFLFISHSLLFFETPIPCFGKRSPILIQIIAAVWLWCDIHSNHRFFGEVTNQITNFKYPIFLFQVIKLCCIIQLQLLIWIVYWLNYTTHFGDLKQKNLWFEIGDLVGDFTKKLVTRMDGAPNKLHLTFSFTA